MAKWVSLVSWLVLCMGPPALACKRGTDAPPPAESTTSAGAEIAPLPTGPPYVLDVRTTQHFYHDVITHVGYVEELVDPITDGNLPASYYIVRVDEQDRKRLVEKYIPEKDQADMRIFIEYFDDVQVLTTYDSNYRYLGERRRILDNVRIKREETYTVDYDTQKPVLSEVKNYAFTPEMIQEDTFQHGKITKSTHYTYDGLVLATFFYDDTGKLSFSSRVSYFDDVDLIEESWSENADGVLVAYTFNVRNGDQIAVKLTMSRDAPNAELICAEFDLDGRQTASYPCPNQSFNPSR